ncbi:unnamed protein product [Caenorhabditis brenneri]
MVPLLKLPKKARKIVIQIIDFHDKVALSFCSKRMKAMAMTRGAVFTDHLIVSIGVNYSIVFHDSRAHVFWGTPTPLREEEMHIRTTAGRGSWIKFPMPNWSVFDRINHVNSLFPGREGGTFTTISSDAFNFDNDIHLIRPEDVGFLVISDRESNAIFVDRIPNHFLEVNSLSFYCRRLQNAKIIRKALMRNLHELFIRTNFRIDFDELLLVNCRYLLLVMQDLTGSQLNKFFKLWKKGSNPRLKFIHYRYSEVVMNQQDILAGIKYFVLPDTYEFRFEIASGGTLVFHGHGSEIRNHNGVRGIIQFREEFFEFFVVD